jgi:hypothetical protein
MFEVLMLVPVADNDGDTFPEVAFDLFEEVLIARFGGFTRYPGSAVGGWVDSGRVYRDATRVYAVVVRSVMDGGHIGEVVRFAKAHFRQEAIFVRYLGVVEIL